MPIEKASAWIKKNLPVVGGLFGDGSKTSGAAASVGGAYLILQIEGLSPEWKAACLTAIVVAWCVAGAIKK